MIAIKTEDDAILTDIATIVAQKQEDESKPTNVLAIRSDGAAVIICTETNYERAQTVVKHMWDEIWEQKEDWHICNDIDVM